MYIPFLSWPLTKIVVQSVCCIPCFMLIHVFFQIQFRIFLKEKKIDVYDEENQKIKISSIVSSDNSTTSINSQSSNDLGTSETFDANEIDDRDPTSTGSSQTNADSVSNIVANIDQYVLFS